MEITKVLHGKKLLGKSRDDSATEQLKMAMLTRLIQKHTLNTEYFSRLDSIRVELIWLDKKESHAILRRLERESKLPKN